MGVLGVVDKSGNLVAVIYHDEKARKQVVYDCTECGMEEIEQLLNKVKENINE